MTTVDAKIMTVVAAIKQSIETSGSPGLSVNAHPNAFFLNVIGAIDLRRAAEHVLARLALYDESLRHRFDSDVERVYAKIKAEAEAGAVNVEDAMARILARAELLVTAGAAELAAVKAAVLFTKTEADVATAASAVDGH